jgi:hypothetical protein
MSDDPGLAWALKYAAADMLIFPVNAAKRPLTPHGFKDASSAPVVIEAWLQKWPYCDFGWALPSTIVVIDIDMSAGRNGFEDFRRLAGCDPHEVAAPMATTVSGGLHIFFAASKAYKNAVAIAGTGIDVRSLGGYVVLPAPGNGRTWLRELIGGDGVMVPLAAAPVWLDVVVKKPPLVLAPQATLIQPASDSDSSAQKSVRAQLERACAKIVAAPPGAQDSTRHAQCYLVGGLIGRGDLGYEESFEALLAAALAMPAYTDPWRNLETRVACSIEAGMAAPLPISANEAWVRNFRARMRLMRPRARHG